MTQGGGAVPVVVSTDPADAGPAVPVAVVSDGRPTLAGPAWKVIVVSDNRPRLAGPALPVVVASGAQAGMVQAGPAMPVYVVSGSLNPTPSFSPSDLSWAFWGETDSLSLSNNDPIPTLNDQSGNTRNLTQATGSLQPLYQTAGGPNSKPWALFDGTDDRLASASFTLNQPFMLYMVLKQITWTNVDRILDTGGVTLRQVTASPRIQIVIATGVDSTALAVGSWGLVTAVINGASSTIAVNGGADVTGDLGGTTALNKITLGSRADGTQAANVGVAALFMASGVHSASNQANMKAWLNTKYALY